jgi:hypothetical protein
MNSCRHFFNNCKGKSDNGEKGKGRAQVIDSRAYPFRLFPLDLDLAFGCGYTALWSNALNAANRCGRDFVAVPTGASARRNRW